MSLAEVRPEIDLGPFIEDIEDSPLVEVRHDIQLPSVDEADPDVIQKSAELLLDVIGFKKPGFGINADTALPAGHLRGHRRHIAIISSAMELLEGEVDYSSFYSNSTNPDATDFGKISDPHMDQAHHTPVSHQQAMTIRLHTAEKKYGAHVALAETRPGAFSAPGDLNRYERHGIVSDEAVAELGYDEDSIRMFNSEVHYILGEGSYDPVLSEPIVHHYDEHPLSSVVFRSKSSMGPIVAHLFTALDPDAPRRDVRTSDFDVYARF